LALKDEQNSALTTFCDGLVLTQLDQLIECLFECLMLRLAIPQNPEDEDYVDIERLRYSFKFDILHFM